MGRCAYRGDMTLPLAVGRFNKRVTNRVMGRLVGFWTFAEIEHVGRRSGRTYRTPVNAFRDGDRVVVGLTYGREVDWLRNVLAADGCRMRLGRQVLDLGSPAVVPTADVQSALPVFTRPMVRLIGVRDCVRLTVLHTSRAPG